MFIFANCKQWLSTQCFPYLCFDHQRPLPQTVQKVEGRQHCTKLLEVTEFELVSQRGGWDPSQRTQAGQGARCHRGLGDLSWHRVRLGGHHSWEEEGGKRKTNSGDDATEMTQKTSICSLLCSSCLGTLHSTVYMSNGARGLKWVLSWVICSASKRHFFKTNADISFLQSCTSVLPSSSLKRFYLVSEFQNQSTSLLLSWKCDSTGARCPLKTTEEDEEELLEATKVSCC